MNASNDLDGKTIVITGANQGIGKEAAIALGARGAQLVLVCRNEQKARAAIGDIERAGAKKVELVVADLSSQRDVRRAAREILAKHARIDVLLNNAGVFVPKRAATVDGVETTLATNHLAYFLLTNLLLDALKAGKARIVNVASRAHLRAKAGVRFDDLQFARSYSAFDVYSHSKLLNVMWTYELARRLQGTGVTANSLHPGVIASGFAQTYGGWMSWVWKAMGPFLSSTKDGARTSIYLASSPEAEGVSGKYFADCKEARSSRVSHDVDAQQRLWRVSEELTARSA